MFRSRATLRVCMACPGISALKRRISKWKLGYPKDERQTYEVGDNI